MTHLGPPSAPSLPKVTIFADIWGHVGVTLELILATVGVSFDDCTLQKLKKGGLGQAIRTRTAFFIDFGSVPRCSGGFSLQRQLCFHFGGQWQIMLTLGGILEICWEQKAQMYLLRGLPESIFGGKIGCRFIICFLWSSKGSQDSQNTPRWW